MHGLLLKSEGMNKWQGRIIAFVVMTCAALVSTGIACAEKKVAFVVGNSAYLHAPQLRNPYNDATQLSEALTRLDFEVIRVLNMGKDQMDRQIQRFSGKMKNADIAVFFYAGHGIQINSKNFLIPVDFDPENTENLGLQLVSLDKVLHEMEKGKHTSIIFLDACRDNPLADQISSNISAGRSVRLDQNRGIDDVRQGLAEVEGKAGTLIAYATQPGNVALDGAGLNSPFTEALLEYIEEPGIDIRDILTKVRMRVMKKTKEKQVPWDHSSLVEKVYFKEKKRWAAPPP
jgi:uncharacterized caspase-like protein